MKFLYLFTLSIAIISVNADCAFAQEKIKSGKTIMPSEMRQAVKDFKACIRGEGTLIFSKDHQICGVVAESRTELLNLLQCPEMKRYIQTSILESSNESAGYVFRCEGMTTIVIGVERASDKVTVSGIGQHEN